MPLTTDEALREVQASLTTQNHRFAAFVEAFSELSADTRIDVDTAILDAIEATTSAPTAHANARSITAQPTNTHPSSINPRSLSLGAIRA